jgi:tetratricopeptide (TPR) repeat protein
MRWVALLVCLWSLERAHADDWGVKRDPFDRVVIARYKAILAKSPHDSVLAPLTALYKSYRTIALLETEYRAQLAAAPADWATLVVLARMPRTDRTQTLELWNRALLANANDARGWLALGKLSHDAKLARAAFQHAVELAANPRDKRTALLELVGAARGAGDHATVDRAYGELIALAPKEGQLWLDRGDAQLAAGHPALALDSFTAAEPLLAIDPERRLVAMTSRGVALERLGRVDEALAQWDATLDRTPRGSYQVRDIVARIVGAERARHQVPAAIARLEKRWKEAQRGYYEWDLLGDLRLESHDDERALVAFRKAVARAPTEVETQRKLIKLLDQLHPSEALAQHEAAAKLAPGEANLQLELAKRYHDGAHDDVKAYAVLDRLTRRHAKSAGVRQAMGQLFEEWEDHTRALFEYEAVANLEPAEEDHAVTLGDLYWKANQQDKALAAWLRLAKIKSAPSQLRLGEIMSRREQWTEAEAAYTRALAFAPATAEAWRGKSRANAELGHYGAAIADARRAVALIGMATSDDGQRMRFELVRALGRSEPVTSHHGELAEQLARWRFAFEHGDVSAGYLLVAHHARIQSHQQHDVLVELYRRVPTDDTLGLAVARSYSRSKDFDRARAEYQKIAARSPKRADDIRYLLEQLEEDRARAAEEKFREEEGFVDRTAPKNLVDRKFKIGALFGVGTDVRGTSSALFDFSVYVSGRAGIGGAGKIRIGALQRDDDTGELGAFQMSATYSRRVLSTRRFEVALGVGPRAELRVGDELPPGYNRLALDGDVVLELLPRSIPATLGARLQHSLTDEVRGSALLFELGFEAR